MVCDIKQWNQAAAELGFAGQVQFERDLNGNCIPDKKGEFYIGGVPPGTKLDPAAKPMGVYLNAQGNPTEALQKINRLVGTKISLAQKLADPQFPGSINRLREELKESGPALVMNQVLDASYSPAERKMVLSIGMAMDALESLWFAARDGEDYRIPIRSTGQSIAKNDEHAVLALEVLAKNGTSKCNATPELEKNPACNALLPLGNFSFTPISDYEILERAQGHLEQAIAAANQCRSAQPQNKKPSWQAFIDYLSMVANALGAIRQAIQSTPKQAVAPDQWKAVEQKWIAVPEDFPFFLRMDDVGVFFRQGEGIPRKREEYANYFGRVNARFSGSGINAAQFNRLVAAFNERIGYTPKESEPVSFSNTVYMDLMKISGNYLRVPGAFEQPDDYPDLGKKRVVFVNLYADPRLGASMLAMPKLMLQPDDAQWADARGLVGMASQHEYFHSFGPQDRQSLEKGLGAYYQEMEELKAVSGQMWSMGTLYGNDSEEFKRMVACTVSGLLSVLQYTDFPNKRFLARIAVILGRLIENQALTFDGPTGLWKINYPSAHQALEQILEDVTPILAAADQGGAQALVERSITPEALERLHYQSMKERIQKADSERSSNSRVIYNLGIDPAGL